MQGYWFQVDFWSKDDSVWDDLDFWSKLTYDNDDIYVDYEHQYVAFHMNPLALENRWELLFC
jgi:hypothetical protein